MNLTEKIEYSINLLKKSEKMALKIDPENGFYLAFSGGKDSQVLYHLAVMGGGEI
jgi:phosphoadenosine phosphosulfate reductase